VDEASKLLEPVPGEHVSGPVLQMRIRLALARSDMETARSQARALYNQLDPEHVTEDGAVVYLATQINSARVELDDAWSVVQQGCAANISDGAMFAALRQLRLSGIARTSDWESRARMSGLAPESYPIGWSWLQGSAKSLEDAERTLERAKPANKMDAAVRLVALQAARYERIGDSPQDTDQELAEMVEALSGLSEEHPPLWLREFLVTTTWRLEKRGQAFGLPRYKEHRATRRRLLAMSERRQKPSSKTSISRSAPADAHPRQPWIICSATSRHTNPAGRRACR
jgi:hypothetical protein